MALNPFGVLLDEMRKLSPGVRGESSELWGMRMARPEIRDSIIEKLATLRTEDLPLLKNLEDPPRPHDWSVSISHTRGLGGWMAVPRRSAQIGWDVEVRERIKPATVERVCSIQEVIEAPMPYALWCAKEAYFKALEDEQPLVLNQLTVAHWQNKSEQLWSWEGFGPRHGFGIFLSGEFWCAAACLVQ